ncbi:MAG: 2-dehydropantoate 2-reductase [Acidobacteriia bacterium]|nr:2-dehydropantoate 2-reductase [Terriglobia bacterium]
MKRICIIGVGSIGSLYAAHLARVAEVWAFVRRPEHARAINEQGIRLTGTHEFHARPRASCQPTEMPQFDLGIVCCKATQTEEAVRPVAHLFAQGAVLSLQNGLGSEEVIHAVTGGQVIRGTTFVSGTRHSDTHVQLELDTEAWVGPYEPSGTPFSKVKEAAELIVAGGLKAVALEDARPAQWTKLIFNASVNSAAALTELVHSEHYAREEKFDDLGHLLHDLIKEGQSVAAGLGITLRDDPWEMNKIGARTDHPPSMLYDIRNKLKTEVDYLGGAIAREAHRAGLPAPLHTALYRLIRGKESSWTYAGKKHEVAR